MKDLELKLPPETKALKAAKEKAADKKHLKDLIVFGLENSSEPVIKNPVMRKALEAKPKKSVNYLSKNYSFEENFKKQSKNINKKKYPTEASPEQFANLAYNLEKNKQMQGAATNLKEFGHRFNENKKEPQYPGMKNWEEKKKIPTPTEPVKIKLSTYTPFVAINMPKPDPQMAVQEKRFNRMVEESKQEKARINNSGLAGLVGGDPKYGK